MTRRGTKVLRTIACAVGALAITAGCSHADEAVRTPDSPAPHVRADDAVRALVPAAVRKRGVLRVAMMNNYKPYSYTVAGKQTGVLPEMVRAVAQVMGVKAEITSVDFSSILTGLQAHRYDIGMGEYFVYQDRLQVADFVTEWSNYDSFIVSASSDYRPRTVADVCGRRIAVLVGSSGVPAMESGRAKCAASGAAAPQMRTYSMMSGAVLALTSNRVDAVLTGHEVGVALKQDGVAVRSSGRVGGGPTATAVSRGADTAGLPEAIAAAYRRLIADGAYKTIHTRWGTDYGVIDDPTVYRPGDTPPKYGE
ncbi:transporter substrate-binding domain-containing protein [Streptomyces malaysiensis]|uniref:transporter substrate-binding domain-containing protein n=1 Tax=Streptomyces malaysiensis TaxID=92644 RepID=UPI00142EFCA2|nr:transporter substrate-binding domain-containing protein [Streptomyces malaysiensis]